MVIALLPAVVLTTAASGSAATMVRACEFCRKRKIRCDTTKPSCSTCRRNDRVCVYHNGPHKQRPSAALVDSLRCKNAALEDTLDRLKNANEAQRSFLLESVVVRNGRVSLAGRNATPTVPLSQSCRLDSHRRELLAQQQLLGGPGDPEPESRTRQNDADATDGEGRDCREDDNSIEDAVSASKHSGAGSFTMAESILTEEGHQGNDGIFSSTSVVHGSTPTRAACEQPLEPTESLRYQLIANAAMERQREHRLRSLATIRGIPAELAFHLLDLHWSRQHHTFLLTYRPAFMRELEHGGPYCSDVLLYAVFACSSKFSERPELRSDPADPETAGKHFFARCDELLLHDGLLAQSSIPTVIALVMLGSTFIARGMTSRGWLYTGYAMRMVYDLGLHVDSQEINKHNVEQVEIRRRVFWGAFICEKLQSLYLGRPPAVRLQDAHVPQEFMDTFEELEPWEPYIDRTLPGAGCNAVASPVPSSYSVSVFQQLCLLSQIITQIIDKIYFVGATPSKTLHELTPLDDALAAWYRELPSHLAYEPWIKGPIDTPAVVAPNQIILLTTYHALIVLLHRPFITTSNNYNGNNNTQDSNATIETPAFSWKRCTTAARHITSLTMSYQCIYPLRKSSYLLGYAVYVACTIHVLTTASASLSAGIDSAAHAESSFLLNASLSCLDALAVPNSGSADIARIIRKLMAAKGVKESPGEFCPGHSVY